jgi:hypothetical protein
VILLRHRGDTSRFENGGRVRWWVAMILALAWLAMWTLLIVVWTSLILDDFT